MIWPDDDPGYEPQELLPEALDRIATWAGWAILAFAWLYLLIQVCSAATR